MSEAARLPVHGFVLAGGKSSRMGQDKAMLSLGERPLIQIAVETLRTFCAEVAIAGNRDDLARFAPVVHEARTEVGPAAGIEAGLLHSRHPWVIFVPVDVPLISATLLEAWVRRAFELAASGLRLSYLVALGEEQPAFCLLHADAAKGLSMALDAGERRLRRVLQAAAAPLGANALWAATADGLLPKGEGGQDLGRSFLNLNTPEDLRIAKNALPPERFRVQ